MLFRAAFLLVLLRGHGSSAQSPKGDTVDLGYVKYLGNRTYPNTNAFLGIPYAEPPLGDRRFRAPLPLDTARVANETHDRVVDATQYPNFCIQGATGSGGDFGGAGTEDCLKVNIYTPAGAKNGDNLPVLFYIHGGGYIVGNPAHWPFEHWIKQSPNIVIVSVYYRLDSFGFLSTPDFADSSIGDFNVGFKDQILSLKWVKKYIHAFGGDPHKVTINGESAGGGAVELHMVAHEDEPLFSGAIGQSVYRSVMATPEQTKPLFEFYAAQAGCGSGPVSAQMSCLRKASTTALVHAQAAVSNFTGSYNLFIPTLDGQLFTETPTKSLLAGRFAQVPLIVGATTNDTLVDGTSIAEVLKPWFPLLTDQDYQDFEQAYPLSDFANDPSLRAKTAFGESVLICARVSMGEACAKRTKAWTYRYNQPDPFPFSPNSGVGHAAENFMMFRGTKTGANGTTTFHDLTPIQQVFSEELIAYWLSFVRSGDPNTYKLPRSPTWPQYGTEEKNRNRIVLQEDPEGKLDKSGSFIELEPVKEHQRCEFVISKVDHEQN